MHWTSSGKRVTDPAKEQLDEWHEMISVHPDFIPILTSGTYGTGTVIHKSNRRSKVENRKRYAHGRVFS